MSKYLCTLLFFLTLKIGFSQGDNEIKKHFLKDSILQNTPSTLSFGYIKVNQNSFYHLLFQQRLEKKNFIISYYDFTIESNSGSKARKIFSIGKEYGKFTKRFGFYGSVGIGTYYNRIQYENFGINRVYGVSTFFSNSIVIRVKNIYLGVGLVYSAGIGYQKQLTTIIEPKKLQYGLSMNPGIFIKF